MTQDIFVFGSNLSGRHGAGAAEFAVREHGAQEGVGEGPTGKSYALPTKGAFTLRAGKRMLPCLSVAQISIHADRFMVYADENKHLTFRLTAVGCGLAGNTSEQIAPLFKGCSDNVFYPPEWRHLYPDLPDSQFWEY